MAIGKTYKFKAIKITKNNLDTATYDYTIDQNWSSYDLKAWVKNNMVSCGPEGKMIFINSCINLWYDFFFVVLLKL